MMKTERRANDIFDNVQDQFSPPLIPLIGRTNYQTMVGDLANVGPSISIPRAPLPDSQLRTEFRRGFG